MYGHKAGVQFVGNKGRFLKSQIKLQLPWNIRSFFAINDVFVCVVTSEIMDFLI